MKKLRLITYHSHPSFGAKISWLINRCFDFKELIFLLAQIIIISVNLPQHEKKMDDY